MTTRVWHETPQPWRLSEYRDYQPDLVVRADRRPAHRGARWPERLHRLVLLPPLRFGIRVRGDSRRHTRRKLRHRSGRCAHIASSGTRRRRTLLITTFSLDAGGVVELTDFMPVTASGHRGDFPEIHRRVRCTRGEAEVVVRFAPRFDYGEPMIRLQPRWNGVLGDRRAGRRADACRSAGHLVAIRRRCCRCGDQAARGRAGMVRRALRRRRSASDRPLSVGDEAQGYDRVLGRVDGADSIHGQISRGSGAIRARAQADVLSADGRDRRGARPPRCRSRLAASATGTIASRGCATPPSCCTRSTSLGTSRRRIASCAF